MAKDTEKLIRQLSLISYLMAERRPVTALEIRRDVEGYSGMNEDAFARRFYADRSELDALGIHLTVNGPSDAAEQ
ncbi:MAG TPA: WYL domain-containing protein, partial [Solirubrobacteraceae bacterium]|nr:WYL domain-containing protein [Solirubrobacteraceae bacterium]